METEDSSGTSIKNQRPSRQDSTISHGTSEEVEDTKTSKSGVPTQAGGNYSDTKVDSSQICGIIEY